MLRSRPGIAALLASLLALTLADVVADSADAADARTLHHLTYMHSTTSEHDWYSICATPGGGVAGYQVVEGTNCATLPGTEQRAQGWYDEAIAETGWGNLYVKSSETATGALQAEAAGFLEGFLTAERIYQQVTNWWFNNFNGTAVDPKVLNFIEQQDAWMRQQIEAAKGSDPYWNTVENILLQVAGMYAGYQASPFIINNPSLPNVNFPYLQLELLQLQDETGDIASAVDPSLRIPDYTALGGLTQTMRALARKSKCSALVFPTPDGQDIFMAHTTWGSYNTMLRIYKLYVVATPTTLGGNTPVPGISVSFSSQPGLFYSNDDYYSVKETQMAIIETTNEIANDTLYDYVVPQTVPTWIRAQLATRLASTGADWARWFSQYNSGTYSNQWMILDSKAWSPGMSIVANSSLLTICSQLPGRMKTQDVSNYLTPLAQGGVQGYWASFNIPFFPDFYVEMGYPSLESQYGPFVYSYTQSYRALLFARETKNISTLEDMQRIMQLNRYQVDPLSKDSPELAIASRYDLANSSYPFAPELMGGIDTKLTSWTLIQEGLMRTVAYSGPTKDDQSPFVWTDAYAKTNSILGHPLVWDFPWVEFALEQDQLAASIATE